MKNTKVERTVDSTITFVVHLDEDEFIHEFIFLSTDCSRKQNEIKR